MRQTADTEVGGERLLLSSLASPYSKERYKFSLDKYLRFHGYKNADELLSKDVREIENEIISFVIDCKENKGMRSGAIMNYIKPVISLCKISDNKMVNSTKIRKFMPPNVRTKKTTKYEREDIAKLLEVADERMKVVILLCSSAGLRIGAIPLLNWGSLKEVDDIYQITVYENEPEKYVTFCSSECKKAILTYISIRKMHKEVITDGTPLVREQWDRRDIFAAVHPRRITKQALTQKISELARLMGVRTRTTMKEGEKHMGASYLQSIPNCNGFRRFFSSMLVNSVDKGLIQTEHRWLLEGHNLKGNDNSYVHISPAQLHRSYMLVHNDLLIDQSHKLAEEVKMLKIEKSKVDLALSQIEEMKKRLKL